MRIDVGGEAVYAYTGSRAFEPGRPTVVFVHGAANDHSVWALQSRYFAYHGHNVLAVDLPAHGRSGGVICTSVEAIARWVVALLDALGVERAALIGHSLGSLVALHVAGNFASRVSRVALLGPAVPMQVSDILLAAARDNPPEAHAMITGWSFSPSHLLGGNRMPGMWMTGNATRLLQRSGEGVLFADLNACNQYMGGLVAAANVTCRSLLILGQRDLMSPPRNAVGLIQALVDKRVLTLADCGHSLMTEAPDAVLDALREFMS
jgi:pimeloyl-ACP methyl ester carboxylesterase